MKDQDEWALQVQELIRTYDKAVIDKFLARVRERCQDYNYSDQHTIAIDEVYAEMFPKEVK